MSNKVRILSIGAAVQDVFLEGDVFNPHKGEDGQDDVEFPLGAKLDLEKITFSTGGGATNGAVTFARQGLESSFMGKIGDDPAGAAVLKDLELDNVDASRVVYSKKYATGYSALLLAPNGERTILTYRGASTHYRDENFDVSHIKDVDWVFITSMAGSMDVLSKLVNHAKESGIKVALIPGKGELKEKDKLKELIRGVSIVSANKEETASLVEGASTEELAESLAKFSGGIAVVTDGPRGVAVCDGKQVSSAGMYEDVPVIDRTGAGDAFASGFTAAIAKEMTIEEAITLASANSTSVVSKVGAKPGILHEDAELHDMEINTREL